MKKHEQWISLLGVVAMAIILPAILRVTNSALRFLVGAEGRLAAIGIETNRVLGPLSSPWKALAQGGDGLKTLLNNTSKDIGDIGVRYIRIDHIYDQFPVVKKDGDQLVFDWDELDGVVRKITYIGAKPFFSLSYMPQALATGDEVSEPKNWDEWSKVVQKTIEHYSGELGIDDVYYEVWNEPDLFGKWTMGGKKDYRTLYLYSVRGAVKASGVKNFKFGGMATTGLYASWIDSFFPYVLQNNLRLDFISWHRYDTDIFQYSKDLDDVQAWIDRHPYFASVEKIISEMGPSSKPGGVNSTALGAAHIVAVSRETLAKLQWGFSFAVEGSFGIVGTPRYGALKMLSQLGDQRLAVTGEGTWIRAIGARKGKVDQVLLVNYDSKEAHNELVPVTFMNLSDRTFVLKETTLDGKTITEEVATDEAILQKEVPMTPNSVVLVELEPK